MEYIITNNAGKQIEGTGIFEDFYSALMYMEGMRFAGISDCYVGYR